MKERRADDRMIIQAAAAPIASVMPIMIVCRVKNSRVPFRLCPGLGFVIGGCLDAILGCPIMDPLWDSAGCFKDSSRQGIGKAEIHYGDDSGPRSTDFREKSRAFCGSVKIPLYKLRCQEVPEKPDISMRRML
jgi:hypothetical protein